jgi:hypothetical protein
MDGWLGFVSCELCFGGSCIDGYVYVCMYYVNTWMLFHMNICYIYNIYICIYLFIWYTRFLVILSSLVG